MSKAQDIMKVDICKQPEFDGLSANDRQVGGTHYDREYQHWDFVCDTGLHYLLACATKYVSRWRAKNGIEDLQKPEHYLQKAIERKITPPVDSEYIYIFADQHSGEDHEVIVMICQGLFQQAIHKINSLMVKYSDEAEASGYPCINTDD